jgi:hypothetical protein
VQYAQYIIVCAVCAVYNGVCSKQSKVVVVLVLCAASIVRSITINTRNKSVVGGGGGCKYIPQCWKHLSEQWVDLKADKNTT